MLDDSWLFSDVEGDDIVVGHGSPLIEACIEAGGADAIKGIPEGASAVERYEEQYESGLLGATEWKDMLLFMQRWVGAPVSLAALWLIPL